MLLTIAKTVTLANPADEVWSFVRDPERVAACLPNVQEFRSGAQAGRYTTTLVERLGPFAVQVPLTIDVTEDAAGRRMTARVAGDDRGGQARVRGQVTALVRSEGTQSVLEVASEVEVLGRMATLGAVPMRRRGDQVFDQFVATIATRLKELHG